MTPSIVINSQCLHASTHGCPSQFLKGRTLLAPIGECAQRSDMVIPAKARVAFAYGYQSIRLRIRQGAQRNRIDDAQQNCVRADAEREGELDHSGEAGVFQQLAEDEFEIIHTAVPPWDRFW